METFVGKGLHTILFSRFKKSVCNLLEKKLKQFPKNSRALFLFNYLKILQTQVNDINKVIKAKP